MYLKTYVGFEAGRDALAQRRQPEAAAPTPESRRRTIEIFGEPLTPEQSVRRILDDVRRDGEKAVRHYTRLLDGDNLDTLEVPSDEIADAPSQVDAELIQALTLSARRVEDYHHSSLPKGWMDPARGLGERLIPMQRVGVYAPGGTASYPSTVLMTAIPARVAGVEEVILCTPSTSPAVMAAAHIAGVDRVFRVGGAQAVGALAYGAGPIPKVDMICGPGNLFVTLAKRMVYGEVAIDGLYGPTETVLIADDSADPVHCAADLLAQAEHDPPRLSHSRHKLPHPRGKPGR